jgi:predicted alpha/beta-fold hydrolase
VKKVCIVFPGLAGDSRSGYVMSLVKYLADECGYTVGVFHNRGVGQELTSAMLPDLTSSEEICEAFTHMIKRQTDTGKRTYFVGIGMSMGANVLLRAAGE